MLTRKMLREMRQNFGQFFSIFLLSLLCMLVFAGMESNVIGCIQSRNKFHDESNMADAWLYGEGFSEEDLAAVRALPFVDSAQLRLGRKGTATNQNGAQIDFYLMTESVVNKPHIVEGEEFDAGSMDGIWLSFSFANAWKISVGDEFSFSYNGLTVTKKVKGLILIPEYEFMCADSDADTVFENIGYVYMNYHAFPARELAKHLIENETITVDTILEKTDLLDEAVEKLEAMGLTRENLTKEALLERLERMTDEQIDKLIPFTELTIVTNDDTDVMEYEAQIAKAIDNNYAAMVDEHSIIGIERVNAEVAQHKAFAYSFALIFVIIALLVIVTTMSRMVEQQRTQIGTMNALGLKRGRILRHYLGYSFFVSLIGGILGLILGIRLMGAFMVDIFAEWYMIPGQHAGYDASFAIVLVLVVLGCTAASYFSCRRLLKVKPSEALRPAPPRQGKNTIFEKLPFWNRLSFNTQYNLRDLSRAKVRAVMGIFGTFVGMMMMVWTLSANAILDDFFDWAYEKIQNFEYEMVLDDGLKKSEAEELKNEVDGELVMMTAIEVGNKEHATGDDKSTQTLLVIEGKGLYNVTDLDTEVTKIPDGTVGITMLLANRLGLQVGDKVYWHIYTENEWHEDEIGVILRNPQTSGLTMLKEDYEKLDEEYSPSLLVTDKDVRNYSSDRVIGIYSRSELRAAMEESFSIINALVAFLIIFSVVLVVIVLYNSGNLSFNERVKEFATLKVVGFRSSQIRRLITVQNLWLSIIGAILGLPFAKPLLNWMMLSNGEDVDYPIHIHFFSILLSAVFVLGTSMLVSFMFSKRIKKLDMVEVLKGIE